MGEVELSIVIASWNTRELLRECLRSLRVDAGHSAYRREIIVVDNASEDGSAAMVETEFPDVVLIRNPENRLYSVAYNQGADLARGRYFCLLNSDIEVLPGSLDRLVAFLEEHPEYGAASPRLLNMDGTVQRSCSRFPTLADPLVDSTSLGRIPPGARLIRRRAMADFDHEHSRDVDQPPTACMVVHCGEYRRMGGLDPSLSLYFNDVDFCQRLWARGRRIRYLAEAAVYHHQGASTRELDRSRRNTLWFQDREAYFIKHHGWVGRMWMRGVLYAHVMELGARISLGPQPRAKARVSRRELLELARQCTAPRALPAWATEPRREAPSASVREPAHERAKAQAA